MATVTFKTRARDGVTVGVVRYYPAPGQKQISVTVPGEIQARRYAEAIEQALAVGMPVPDPPDENGRPRTPRGKQKAATDQRGPVTLHEFFIGPYMQRKWPEMSANTQSKYRSAWNTHITHPVYGVSDRALVEFPDDPEIIDGLLRDMTAAGCSGATRANVLSLLASIFTQAMRTRGIKLSRHPVRGIVEYPSTKPAELPVPQTPQTVALVAARFDDSYSLSAEASRLYMMLMNVCGVRPQEARALRVSDIGEQSLTIVRAVGGDGAVKDIKNAKWHYPPIPSALSEAVREWARRDGLEHDAYLWPSMQSKDAHRSWTKNVFRPALAAVGTEQRKERPTLATATPYDLGRHSFVTLYLRAGYWESYKRAQLASWIGDNVRTLENHYARELAEYSGRPGLVDAEYELVSAWLGVVGDLGKSAQQSDVMTPVLREHESE